jgi:hypothetical protein
MYEIWSLPWHVLQKNLARNSALARHSAVVGADSWLSRARCRGATLDCLQTVILAAQDREMTHGPE